MKFNNKILLLITVLSIVLGLVASKFIPFLNNFRTVSCIVVFFSAIMLYNAYIRGKEMKANQKALKDLEEKEALYKIKYANSIVDVDETASESVPVDDVNDNPDSNATVDIEDISSKKQ